MSEQVKTMPEEQGKEEDSSPVFLTSIEVVMPSTKEKRVIKKLKAGKYYEAQKLYVEWIEGLQKLLEASQVDLKGVSDGEGNPDMKKIEKELAVKKSNVQLSSFLSSAESVSGTRFKLLAVCLGESEKEILENYYPEDVEELLDKAVQLNNFLGNLKKSATPSVGGGV